MAGQTGAGESSGMTFEDWIFAMHLLFAATLVGSLVMSWIVVVASRTADTPGTTLNLHRVASVATGATVVGLFGVIAFGIWLAILRVDFHPWDGWVIAAIVLWGIATVALLRSFGEYAKPVERAKHLLSSGQTGSSTELTTLNRTVTGLVLRALASVAVVLIVIDMIWKPGA
jgi:type IV secretory pathway VirB2 component (pilin)